jgi:hypothetical protein
VMLAAAIGMVVATASFRRTTFEVRRLERLLAAEQDALMREARAALAR